MLSSDRRRSVTVVSAVLTLVALAAYVAVVPVGVGAEVRALVGLDNEVPGDTPGAHHAFLQTEFDGMPVGWDPCRPVRYVVNPAGAPAQWATLVSDAVAEVEAATGLDLVDEGTTTDRTFEDREARGPDADPVLIGWADATEVGELAGDVAGLGGAVSVSDGSRRHYTTGSLALDTETYARLAGRADGEEVERAILLHELGHVMGLAHVDDRGELMYTQGVPRATFGPGDREGLAALGALPCG